MFGPAAGRGMCRLGKMSWSTFLDSAPAAGHGVQFYGELDELARSLGRFLSTGFETGSPAIVIARDDHRARFAEELEQRGLDRERLEADGLLIWRDADELLASFAAPPSLSPERFDANVGALVRSVRSRRPGVTIRAFGEMVDVLWQGGRREDAIALEALWNELVDHEELVVLCGYHLDLFDPEEPALLEVFRLHTHVRPAADPSRFASALDRALVEVVGPWEAARVYLDAATSNPTGSRPHALLAWLGGSDAALAADVLRRTRAHYVASAAA